MRLYEIPKESKILLLIGREGGVPKDEMCIFHHIDGMFSYITTESGGAVHLGAHTEVKAVGDHYEVI